MVSLRNRAQSAVEFLMTYGWVVVVAGASVVVLWQMGAIGPTSCSRWSTGFSQVVPTDWGAYADSNTLVFRVENQAGDRLEVVNVNAVVGDMVCSLAPDRVINPGDEALLVLDCSGSILQDYGVGGCYTAEVNITYVNLRSGYIHESRGKVRGPVEEGVVTTTTTSTTTSTTSTTTTSTSTTSSTSTSTSSTSTSTTSTTIDDPPEVNLILPSDGGTI